MKKLLLYFFYFILFILVLQISGIVYVALNQQKLVQQLTSTLKKNIRGELNIEKVKLDAWTNFPHISLQLQQVNIKDSLYKKDVLNIENAYLSFNFLKLLLAKIDVQALTLENGSIYLQKDSSGYFNAAIFKVNSDSTSSGSDINFGVKKLKIKNIQFAFYDQSQDQHIAIKATSISGKVDKLDSVSLITLIGTIHTDSMVFKAEKGAFLLNKDATLNVQLILDLPHLSLTIRPSPIYVDEEQYDFAGKFNFAQKPATMSLRITNPAVKFAKAKTILSSVLVDYMKGIEINDPIAVDVQIKGEIIPKFPPQVNASFKLRNATITAQGVHLTHTDLDGEFINYVKPNVKNDDYNSAIGFKIYKAEVEGIPFKATVQVADLKALHIKLSASLHANLTSFNQAIPSSYSFEAGKADIDLVYEGTLYYYLDSIKRNFDDTLLGKIKITNGAFLYKDRNLQLRNFTADIDVNQKQFNIKELSGALNGSNLKLSGTIDNVRRIFSKEENVMVGNFSLSSPKFELAKMLELKTTKTNAAPPAPKDSRLVAATINKITSELSAKLNFNCNLFTFNKLTATDVNAQVFLSANGIQLKDFKLNACKGNVTINGGLNTTGKQDKIEATLNLKNVDVQQLLQDGENFKQDAITHQNLQGRFSTALQFSALLDNTYTPLMQSIIADANYSLKQGYLIDIEQLKNVGKYIFKKRDFTKVQFADIQGQVTIKQGEMAIKRMEVSANILRVFVQGKYAFSGVSDITIEFPFSNFKKQELNYEPSNMGIDAKTGSAIFVRLRGANNKMKVSLDAGARKRLAKEALQ